MDAVPHYGHGDHDGGKTAHLGSAPVGDLCPSCGNTTLVAIEGCQTCYSCGHSEC
jgi:hypothetical protein